MHGATIKTNYLILFAITEHTLLCGPTLDITEERSACIFEVC
jgi:hypothetical protein